MPSQVFKIFKITHAPEAKPITAQQLKSMLWRNLDRSDSEWEVEEIQPVPKDAFTAEQIKAWLIHWELNRNGKTLYDSINDPQSGIAAVTNRKGTK